MGCGFSSSGAIRISKKKKITKIVFFCPHGSQAFTVTTKSKRDGEYTACKFNDDKRQLSLLLPPRMRLMAASGIA